MSDLSEIYNFKPISNSLATSGQPKPEQFALIKDAGYDVVINIASGKSPNDLPNEGEIVRDNGMDYVHIPVDWENPTDQNLQDFFVAMNANSDKKRYVHCIANWRVTAFTMLYRVLALGEAIDEARATMYSIWSPQQESQTWVNFINKHLPEGIEHE